MYQIKLTELLDLKKFKNFELKRKCFIDGNKEWEILIPQICIDCHDWENLKCTNYTSLNLF